MTEVSKIDEIIEEVAPVKEEPKIEEVAPVKEEPKKKSDEQPAKVETKKKANKLEKKIRSQVDKLQLKDLKGVRMVVIKVPGQGMDIIIRDPEIKKTKKGDAYVIFGKIETEDPNRLARNNASEQLENLFKDETFEDNDEEEAKVETDRSAKEDVVNIDVEKKETEDVTSVVDQKEDGVPKVEEVVDSEGLPEEDIEIVMTQTGKTRKQVIEALKKNEGDKVSAILSLS